MKKLVMISALVMLMCFTAAFNAEALSILGYANPDVGGDPAVDDTLGISTFSQINYYIDIIDVEPDEFVNFVSVEFEGDVFAGLGALNVIHPAGWTIDSATTGSGSYSFVRSTGTDPSTYLNLNEQLAFSIMNVEVYNRALESSQCPGINCLWDEGGLWEQSLFATGQSVAASFIGAGGSTAPIPEPGTLALLSSGLIGVVVYARKKKCLMSI